MPDKDAKHELLRVLAARQLLRAVGSQSVSTFANQVIAFVVPWLVLSRTGSALSAGGVACATGVAAVLGSLGGGIIVDRLGGRKTAIIADVLSFATVLVLPVALFLDFLPLWLILATQTLGVLFDGPGAVARDTLIPTTAEHDQIPLVRATSLQETLQNTAMFVGPLAAGLLIAALNEGATLLAAAALFLLALALVAGVERRDGARGDALTPRRALDELREGFRFLANDPLLKPLTLLITAWVAAFAPLLTLVFPAWFVLGGQRSGALGLFLGARALGGILGGLAFAAVAPKVSGYKWLLLSNILATATLAALLPTRPGSAVAVLLTFLGGVIDAGVLPILNAAYYSRTPEPLLGRVNGASQALTMAVLPLSSLFYGWLVNAFSATAGIALVAVCNGAMTVAFWLIPAMKLIDAKQAESDDEPESIAGTRADSSGNGG